MRMIKTIMSLLAVSLLAFSVNSFAADMSSLHTSKQSGGKAMRSAGYVRTDVHVLNSSSQVITVKVPGTAINDLVYPHEVDDILSDIYFDSIEVVLYDEAGYEFFRDFVPNHATIEVRNSYMPRSAPGAAESKPKVQAVIKK